jgi:hypothetical protein
VGDVLILVWRFQFCNSRIVSTLASCERLPATVPDLANRPQQLVFLTPIDSQLNDFLNEIHLIALFEPSIVERIDEDLDRHAKKKKLRHLRGPNSLKRKSVAERFRRFSSLSHLQSLWARHSGTEQIPKFFSVSNFGGKFLLQVPRNVYDQDTIAPLE